MFSVTCPFCYHRVNRLTPWFVCSGRHTPGYKPCEKEIDARRQRETGFEEPMYPVFRPPWARFASPRRSRCPSCRGRTGERACAVCHTPLPPNFGGAFSPVIAVVGARSTGKTVYLTVVGKHLRSVLRDRFQANVWLYPDDARAWLDAGVAAIFDDRTLPIFTEQKAGRSEPLVFEWRQRSRSVLARYRSSYLSFLDTAGESLGTQRGVTELRFLAGVDAFIVLLDPFTLPGARERLGLPAAAPAAAAGAFDVLAQVTGALRNAGGISPGARSATPIAVAFAKFDALRGYLGETHPIFASAPSDPWYDDAAGRAIHESVRELLREWGARDIDEFMDSNYTNYRYFAVSSLGRPPDYANNTVAAGGVKPLRVEDPLVWLLSLYRLVPRRRRRG
jgi:hypothetical protein